MDLFKTFRSAILAGVCISLGGAVYLSVGGIAGAVLFSFGLLAVVHFGYRLYTGTAGFIVQNDVHEWIDMLFVILGNIVGCALVAGLMHLALPDRVEAAGRILEARIAKGWLSCGALGMGCGFIMTVAVKFGRQGKNLPILFGVPVFILCGFTHSIADAFYYLAAPWSIIAAAPLTVLGIYISIVLGNFIGCNIYRWILPENV